MSGLATRVAADDAHAEMASDEVLVRRVAMDGDQDALSQLYDRYQAQMYGLAIRITNDAGMAQDAVQEAFVGIWRNAARYLDTRASVRTWMLSITHHGSIDLLRRRRPNVPLPETESVDASLTAPDVWPEVARAADADAIRVAMSRLSDEQREAIDLAYFGGLTQTEIAARVGAPLGTIKSRVRLGLLQLRRMLEDSQ